VSEIVDAQIVDEKSAAEATQAAPPLDTLLPCFAYIARHYGDER
jgi:hypothetical protein